MINSSLAATHPSTFLFLKRGLEHRGEGACFLPPVRKASGASVCRAAVPGKLVLPTSGSPE